MFRAETLKYSELIPELIFSSSLLNLVSDLVTFLLFFVSLSLLQNLYLL